MFFKEIFKVVTITNVIPGSYCDKAGIKSGDILISVDGNDINDILDYRFYITEKKISLKIHQGPELFDILISKKDEYDDIGLEFETYLMDKKRSCRNKCVFCFIDQLPCGLRESLYFKDDDSRLSFLMGNYITLTNLSENDIERIIKMKTSPINISVHTTNPELRNSMMNNKNAGKAYSIMKRFADAGIIMNCQIVLCKGLNDKAELDRSMRDLAQLYPKVASVSVVPAGLTKFRDNLYPLEPFSPDEGAKVIAQVEAFADECLEKYGSRIFFCGDEMYLKSGIPLHDEEYFEGCPQIENGVGLVPSMKASFDFEFEYVTEYDIEKPRNISVATGYAAYDFISYMVEKLKGVSPSLDCKLYKIKNNFFGENITVAGLMTGADLYEQLKDKPLGDILFLPSVTLRHEGDMFLDSMTVDELSEKLGVELRFIDNDGAEFISSVLY